MAAEREGVHLIPHYYALYDRNGSVIQCRPLLPCWGERWCVRCMFSHIFSGADLCAVTASSHTSFTNDWVTSAGGLCDRRPLPCFPVGKHVNHPNHPIVCLCTTAGTKGNIDECSCNIVLSSINWNWDHLGQLWSGRTSSSMQLVQHITNTMIWEHEGLFYPPCS